MITYRYRLIGLLEFESAVSPNFKRTRYMAALSVYIYRSSSDNADYKTEEARLQLTECVVVLGPRLQVTATVCFVICQDKTNLY